MSMTDNNTEPTDDAVADEVVEAIAEEIAEEIIEEAIVEEIVEEIAEEIVEEAIVEEIAEESVAEEIAEEIVEAELAEGDAAAVLDEAEFLEEEAAPKAESPYDRPGRWYVLHTQSGYENKVRQNLEARTHSMNMEERIHEVVIPLEDVVEIRNGKKVVVQKKMFPGYLLVRCALDDDSWYVIRNTPGVTGFVGAGNKPSPLPRRDVETFLTVKTDEELETAKRSKPAPRVRAQRDGAGRRKARSPTSPARSSRSTPIS